MFTSEKVEHTVSSPASPPYRSSLPMNSNSLILLGDSPLSPLPGGDEKKGDEATELCETFAIPVENRSPEGDESVLGVFGKPGDSGFLD